MIVYLLDMPLPAGVFPFAKKIADTVVDSRALTINNYGQAINGLSFQQHSLITCNGWQYVAYCRGTGAPDTLNGCVCVVRRKLAGDSGQVKPAGVQVQGMFSPSSTLVDWQVIELSDYPFTTNDAHNVVAMGICPNDGTIHLAFDHHDSTLHYRMSQTGAATDPDSVTWDAALFGPTHSDLVSGDSINSVCYPRFWQTPDGNLQCGFRIGNSGNGDWWMVDYSGKSGLWGNKHQVINRHGTYSDSVFNNSTSRNPYMNPPAYSPDGSLHLTWTWRESASDCNHDIMYAYSSDGGNTWYNTFGIRIADNSLGQRITLDSPGVTIRTLDTNRGMINQQAQAVDAQGRVHTVMFYCNAPRSSGTFGRIEQRRYYHEWRDTDGTWHRNGLYFNTEDIDSWVGSRPKLFIRPDGNAYVIYQSWQKANLTDTEIYIGRGNLVIQAATADTGWSDWKIIHVETGPFVGEALADVYRFEDGILSVMVQNSPPTAFDWTPLRILDFQVN